jgi:thiamine-monophosphate kinase
VSRLRLGSFGDGTRGRRQGRWDVEQEARLDHHGEAGVLARILPLLPAGRATLLGPGDDAAVVSAPDGRVVISTDVLVEGRDFRRDWSSGADVGWKAAAQNLADVAAMGAVPTALVVALAAPADLPLAWAEDLARGLAEACEDGGAGVVGGDLSSSSEIVVSVTVLGDLQGRAPVRRDGARPGDVVAIAGTLGRSAAGFAALSSGRPGVAPDLVAAHRRPRPPLPAGPAAADAGATSMIDVSDGLLLDLARVAEASGVAVDLDRRVLARLAGPLMAAASGDAGTALGWVLTGGEDHALAAGFPAAAALPAAFERVGRVMPRPDGGPPVLVDGRPPAVDVPGWDHFAPRPNPPA